LYDVESPAAFREIACDEPIRSLAFDSADDVIYVASVSSIAAWGPARGTLSPLIDVPEGADVALCSHTPVAIVADSAHITRWDLQKKARLSVAESSVASPMTAFRSSADGKRAVSVHADLTIGWWDLDRGLFTVGLKATSPVTGCALSEDGRHV